MNLKALQETMLKEGIDGIFLGNINHKDSHLYYLTHIEAEYTFLIITPDKTPTIYASSLEYEKTKNEAIIKNVKMLTKHPFKILQEEIKKNRYKKIGINKGVLTINEFDSLKKMIKDVEWVDINKTIYQIREQKTSCEIKAIKKACSIGDKIFTELIKNFKKCKTELDVANFIEQKAKHYGCTISFPVIVGSGENGAMPHYTPKNVTLNKGFCVLDFGVRYQGYCSDMTRTIYIGKPSEQERRHYQLVLEAIYESRKIIKIGLQVKKTDELIRKKFGKLNKFYIHSLGHGLGTEVHEPPGISYKSKEEFKNNMVFTIEPGIYFPGKYGIRIEDDYVLENNRLKQLTSSTDDLIIIN
ncbi:aminopeptidase P family protein [Candidatus Woesearchaeota archaeon]|nr:aminopeptidase P family protein [Candidatus Woesearchaeota archaeon]